MTKKNFWLRTSKLFSVLVGLAFLLVPVMPSFGQTSNWSEPMAISFGWFSDIAADASGRVHLVWSSGTVGYDVVMYSTTMDGKTWSIVNDIAAKPTLGAVTRPTILIDPLGMFHMTFKDYTVYYTHGPADSITAASLIPYQQVSKGAGAYFSKVVRDSQGRLHFIITETVLSSQCSFCLHVFYRLSDDNGKTMSDLVDISEATQTGAAKPQVVLDKQDNIHVVWEAGRGGDLGQLLTLNTKVFYAVSRDRGVTWETPVEFQTPAIESSNIFVNGTAVPEKTTARNVVIGMDGKGQLVVAWLGLPQDQIYYRTSGDQGRTWTDPQTIPDVWGGWSLHAGKLDTYTMATDSAGHIHLAFVGRTVADPKLRLSPDGKTTVLDMLHVTWDGNSWSNPETVTTLIGDVPEWPRLAVSNGNILNLTWFVRDQENIFGDPSGYQVWYARGISSSPAISSVSLPTQAPTVQPTNTLPPVSTISPNVTATIDFANLPPATVNGQEPYTESNLLVLIFTSVLPAVLLTGIIVAVVLLRRR